jgi:hypothetical protein
MRKYGKSEAKAQTMAYVAIPKRPKGKWLVQEAAVWNGHLYAMLDVELVVHLLANSGPMTTLRCG